MASFKYLRYWRLLHKKFVGNFDERDYINTFNSW